MTRCDPKDFYVVGNDGDAVWFKLRLGRTDKDVEWSFIRWGCLDLGWVKELLFLCDSQTHSIEVKRANNAFWRTDYSYSVEDTIWVKLNKMDEEVVKGFARQMHIKEPSESSANGRWHDVDLARKKEKG
jgi:hypothetical protein